MITVTVPVGPNPIYRRFLPECLQSIRDQKVPASEILVIDDQAHLEQGDVGVDVRLWKTPWLSGVAHVFNYGVALAASELVLMLGSDDILKPWCIEDIIRSYQSRQQANGYYWLDVEYSTGETQALACNAAAVTKGLWRHTGGFPVESALGAPDTMLLSIMLAHKGAAGRMFHVESHAPPYWYRQHPDTDTRSRAAEFSGAIGRVRDVVTQRWRKPEWTR